MKTFKITAWILLAAFVTIQFFPTERNQSALVPKTDFLLANDSPQFVKSLLQESCYDCHSNNTNYPWYNKIQPAAWYLEDHVKEGKNELNFNTWDELTNRRKKSKLKSIINQVRDNEMPLYSYTLIHRNAALSDSDKTAIMDYMNGLIDAIE